jgi:hypothetical protein
MSPTEAPRFDAAQVKRSFDEDGFVVLPNVVPRPLLANVASRLANEFDSWTRSTQSFSGGGLMSGHLNCFPGEVARGVVDTLRESGTLALAQTLLPTPPNSARIGCNFNLPGSVAQHYHADGAFLQRFLIVNVAVVDTDLVNGAIEVIPKTHKRFYKYWEFAMQRVYRDSIRVPLSQGDVLIRLSTVWHRGMPNHSAQPRPMLALTLGERGVNAEDPCAVDGGRVEFQTNWFTTSWFGRLRERTTVLVPVTYSAYRFGRSLVGNKGYASY